jgi:hypothetical protein
MRKIEIEMMNAVVSKMNYKNGNTEVQHHERDAMVYLHGNHIATVPTHGAWVEFSPKDIKVNVRTLLAYPTKTTMSRLRALGVCVFQKNNKIYLDGEVIA